MSFFDGFEPPPSPPAPQRMKVEPWMGKPQGWLGGWVGWHGTLLQGPDVRVVLEQVLAYPSGVSFEMRLLRRPGREDDGMTVHRMLMGGGRYGVEFSDGRRVVSKGRQLGSVGEPDGPVLLPGGGSGGAGEWKTSLWLWPLPPPGALRLASTWPEQDCAETIIDFDADEVLDAASNAEHLWDAEPPTNWAVTGSKR